MSAMLLLLVMGNSELQSGVYSIGIIFIKYFAKKLIGSKVDVCGHSLIHTGRMVLS